MMPQLDRLVVVTTVFTFVHEAGHVVILLGCLASVVVVGGEAGLELLIFGFLTVGGAAAHMSREATSLSVSSVSAPSTSRGP